MRTSNVMRRHRTMTALLRTACIVQASLATLAWSGIAHGTTVAAAEPAPSVVEADRPHPAADDRPAPMADATLVTPDRLDQTRGGFELSDRGNTLRVTFGLERAIYVNGALVTSSALSFDGMSRLASSGNMISMNPTELPTGALLLQNSLNDQRLEARTMINAVVEGAHLMRAARLESIMRDSSIDAVRR